MPCARCWHREAGLANAVAQRLRKGRKGLTELQPHFLARERRACAGRCPSWLSKANPPTAAHSRPGRTGRGTGRRDPLHPVKRLVNHPDRWRGWEFFHKARRNKGEGRDLL
jgi:hypothetical protein